VSRNGVHHPAYFVQNLANVYRHWQTSSSVGLPVKECIRWLGIVNSKQNADSRFVARAQQSIIKEVI
jgi:hypothetical protein